MSNRRREGTGGHLAGGEPFGEHLRHVGESRRTESQKSAENIDEKKGERCFVASAVYGGGDVEQVRILREYRDNVLMQDEIGRRFVEWYYNGGGDKIASFIEKKARFLMPIIRKGLDVIVEDYEIRKRT